MRGARVERLDCREKAIARRSGRREADFLGVERTVLVLSEVHKWHHETGREVVVGRVRDEVLVVKFRRHLLLLLLGAEANRCVAVK